MDSFNSQLINAGSEVVEKETGNKTARCKGWWKAWEMQKPEIPQRRRHGLGDLRCMGILRENGFQEKKKKIFFGLLFIADSFNELQT